MRRIVHLLAGVLPIDWLSLWNIRVLVDRLNIHLLLVCLWRLLLLHVVSLWLLLVVNERRLVMVAF